MNFISNYYCQGTVNISNIKIKHKNSKFISLPTSPDNIKSITKHLDIGSFGRENEEVIDTNYRNAYVANTDDYETNFNIDDFNIKEIIINTMNEYNIYFKRDKLNIYEKNGFFKLHKDTPKSQNMIGTLVVCLPQYFNGGTLMLGNEPINFDCNKLHWCAFYSDINHEVLPVKDGYRITITYQIYKNTNDVNDLTQINLLKPMIKENQQIGYKCQYLYSGNDPILKGQDALFYQLLKKLNLNPQIVQIYRNNLCQHTWCNNCEKKGNAILQHYEDWDTGFCYDCYDNINNNSDSDDNNSDDYDNHKNYKSVFYTLINNNITNKEKNQLKKESPYDNTNDFLQEKGRRLSNKIKWFNNPNNNKDNEAEFLNMHVIYGNEPGDKEQVYRSYGIFVENYLE